MSDVEAVSSLPASLDPGQSAFAVKVNHQSTLGHPPSKRATPPVAQEEDVPAKEVDPAVGDGDGPPSPKADSEAETIIQSGRESLSPEKRRKFIKHEPKRRDDANDHVDAAESELPPNDLHVRKIKSVDGDVPSDRDRPVRPASPLRRVGSPAIVKIEKTEEPQAVPSKVEPSQPITSAPRTSRKRSFSESVDGEADARRNARQHHSAAPRDRERRDLNGISLPRPTPNDRSVSPVRAHKRTASGPQLGSDLHRKRKAPTPLISGVQRQSSEDRQSVSSSTSGSPLPSAYVRKVASVDGASASPARPTGHKKQRDQNGRTRLARACAAQELDVAIARHAERPEDLNVADNAGNTPLQIASLEGCASIVKFLLEAGCEVETRNIDRDTPLIDAVENGHLDVVKLLLQAGANPRAVNAEGDEPSDLIPSDSEDFDEIRRVLEEAKANPRPSRRSEEQTSSGNRELPSRRVTVNSPRESPPVSGQRSPPFSGLTSKRKSVRSEATRNDLLWTKATPENLQAFAAKGDMAGVANILNVGQRADAESMIAAAKGGHDEVLSLLLGMGDADPDPDPVQSGTQKPGYNTPMLAAIGRGNLPVIKLLLAQPSFDPTRRLYKDRTYFELSRDRRADNWEEEYDCLREAYDEYRSKKQRKGEFSSPRRVREKEKERKRAGRRESPSPVGRPRKAVGSPVRRDSSKDALSKERRREAMAHAKEKPSVARPKVVHVAPDHDTPRFDPARSKGAPTREGDSTRGDEAPKRRRLIAGRPPDRDRRVPSVPPTDSMPGRDDNARARTDHPDSATSKPGPPPLKRGRSSVSPDRPRSRDTEAERHPRDMQKKKRRVLSEDGTPNITNGGVKKSQTTSEDLKVVSRHKDDHHVIETKRDHSREPDAPSKATERNPVKEEQEKHETHDLEDIPMEDSTSAAEAEAEARRQKEAQKAAEERQAEEARIAAESERARVEEEERTVREARLAQEKAAEEERKRQEAEQRRIKQAEDERQRRLEQERQRLAKLRREQEEQEQRRRDALPSRLRAAANLVGSNDPQAKSHVWLKKFMPVVTAETQQLDPSCGAAVADDKWIPNYLVAPLLATNDLQLSQYASWEKRQATPTQRMNLWRVTRRMLVQAEETEFLSSSFEQIMQKDSEARPKYFEMEHVFWVKLSDFMDLVPHIPHLHGLDIQLLKMHIDQEPKPQPVLELPPANGHISGGHIEEAPGLLGGTGLTNGYGHSRASTYV
ncbi:putative histone deacetylase complex subunit (Hos4) [Aspergillus ibericus CBS 121593]|uniref:Histone deacetylase complex subunit n=1 Tax=Aspergillus ibericus CBS 121593 TaxID=1448316 RepID=A0A395GVL6_9EURO|nr:histone deacetylase complex subunit [Aspergillus ibericus CBS 121593]RAK99048.1 histone deacetylase complex subunit [Aspergillus ibericus CBS 121593]